MGELQLDARCTSCIAPVHLDYDRFEYQTPTGSLHLLLCPAVNTCLAWVKVCHLNNRV